MKKLTRVIFILGLLLMVVLPLSAKKTMSVTWQWVLSDENVTAYRYQINGEKDGEWITVDGKTDFYTASGLDPYEDYTLYLQCSYDGVNWSESALSRAAALLKREEEPLEDTLSSSVGSEEEKAASTSGTEKYGEGESVFYVFGYGVKNVWKDGVLTSETMDEGIVSESDVEAFMDSELDKYPLLDSSLLATLPDGFALDYRTLSVALETILEQYEKDLNDYVRSLSLETEEEAENLDFDVLGYTLHNTYKGTTFSSYVDEKGVILPSDILLFIDYENGKYPYLEDVVTVDGVEDGSLTLTVPENLDFNLYISEYRNEIFLYLASLVKESAVKTETVEVGKKVETGTVEEEKKVEETTTVLRPSAVEYVVATPVDNKKSRSGSVNDASFNISLGLGAEAGFTKGTTYMTLFPKASLSLEGRNLIRFGSFGLGVRGDISSLFIPESRTLQKLSGKWGFDITADLLLTGNFNIGKFDVYLGIGAGYSLASSGYTTAHSSSSKVLGMNTAFALSALIGGDYRITDTFYLSLEASLRGLFTSPGKIGEYGIGASLGFGFRF